jgi:TRAP-type C4-dicarboxylate transport system permease small subunit
MTTGRPEEEIGSSFGTEVREGASVNGPSARVLRPTLLERALVWIGCGCAVVILLLSMADIVLRALSVEFFMAGEANGILMAWMIFLAMPLVTRTRSHISIDFLDRLLQLRSAFVLRIFGYLVMLGYVAVLSWYCGQLAWSAYLSDLRSSSILRWPVVYAQLGVLVGLVLVALTQCLMLLADLRDGWRGKRTDLT